MTCLAFLIPIFGGMNSEEEGRDRSARVGSLARSTTEIGGLEGGIFGKIYYGDWRDWRVGFLAISTTEIGGTGG